MTSTWIKSATPRKACHNCRRGRLKCDRSVPQCHKCMRLGQECLGYENLLRWNQGVASRGKMMGVSYDDVAQPSQRKQQAISAEGGCGLFVMSRPLTDPLFQDLTSNNKYYLSYCKLSIYNLVILLSTTMLTISSFLVASSVSKDLVIYDTPTHNPLRDLISMTGKHAVLRHIMIASSALHIANISRKRFALSDPSQLCPNTIMPLQSLACSSPTSYRHALLAKQRALQLLSTALNNMNTELIDIALATVLLFVEFELIDSGKNDWRQHVNGARTIIWTLREHYQLSDSNMSSLRRCLISNCLVYVSCLAP